MQSDVVSNYSVDPDANHFSEINPSLEGVNNSQYYVVIHLKLPYTDHRIKIFRLFI